MIQTLPRLKIKTVSQTIYMRFIVSFTYLSNKKFKYCITGIFRYKRHLTFSLYSLNSKLLRVMCDYTYKS